jgi:hypothetical protein
MSISISTTKHKKKPDLLSKTGPNTSWGNTGAILTIKTAGRNAIFMAFFNKPSPSLVEKIVNDWLLPRALA